MIRILLLVLLATEATAATLEVGPERKLNSPAAALALAGDGDTILIDEGEYYECLRIGGDHLTIQGRGAGAVFTDTTCDGKAIIIAQGERITLRNLTLQRARVKDGNGAGIRAEGGALDIDKVRFLNNQAGLVIGHNPAAIVTVRDSQFTDTGRCDAGKCAPAITAGVISRLRLEHTRLSGTAGAHQVVSAAASTEIISSLIEDGPRGSASFQLIISAGGSLLLEDSVIQKGPRATNLRAAILLDGTMGGPITLRRNHYLNDTGADVPFVLDWSDTSPTTQDNVLPPGATEVSSSGILTHRATNIAREAKDTARGVAGAARRTATDIYRRLRGG